MIEPCCKFTAESNSERIITRINLSVDEIGERIPRHRSIGRSLPPLYSIYP